MHGAPYLPVCSPCAAHWTTSARKSSRTFSWTFQACCFSPPTPSWCFSGLKYITRLAACRRGVCVRPLWRSTL